MYTVNFVEVVGDRLTFDIYQNQQTVYTIM